MNRITVLGNQYWRSSFPRSRDRCRVAGPIVSLNALEGLLLFQVGHALGVDSRGVLRLRLCLASSSLVDDWDGYVTCLEACAARSCRLVLRDSVNLQNALQ